jgi:hypothetical protein
MARKIALLWLIMLTGPMALAVDIPLYDASLGTLPENQPWLFYAQDAGGGGAISKALVAGGTGLTTDNANRAGWSNTIPILNTFKNPAFPSLSPSQGFELSWSMQILAENHASQDRAGTSVILLGSDNHGIELGFWSGEIWAQTSSPLFTHGESVVFNTSSAMVNYRLLISGSNYLLYGNNSQILSGQTRSYAAFGSAPYTLNNYFFIGDNTTSAGASMQMQSIRIITPVPEPAQIVMGALSVVIIGLIALKQKIKMQSGVSQGSQSQSA